MNRRDIVIGVVILAILSGVIYWRQRTRSKEEAVKIPQTLSVEDKIEEKFKLIIPEDVDKAELKDVSGGTGSALATKKFENGRYELSLLADLADPEQGKFYQSWLSKGEEGQSGYSLISLGKLTLSKGGWMLNFNSGTDYSDHSKIVVSLEKTSDKNPEQKILEGSF